MKIVHLTTNFYPVTGGIETYVYEISKRFAKMGHKVYVVTSDKTLTSKKLRKHEKIDGVEVFRVPFKRVSRYNISYKALKTIMSLKCDVVHIHGLGGFSDLIPFLKIGGRKVVISTHGGIFHTKNARILKKIYFNIFSRFALNFADKILAHSKQDLKTFSKICKKDKIFLSPYGIDWRELNKIKRKSDGKTLVYTGRLTKNKRIDRMLHVLHFLRQNIPDIKLMLIGEDWGEKNKLIGLSNRLGIRKNVVFIDSVPHKNIGKYLSMSDVFLLSSEYEGFGISVLEALATGMPVVVNKLETMKEIVKNGYNGYIVDFDNYKKASNIILEVLKSKFDPRIIRSSVKRFDWNGVCKEIEKVYKER